MEKIVVDSSGGVSGGGGGGLDMITLERVTMGGVVSISASPPESLEDISFRGVALPKVPSANLTWPGRPESLAETCTSVLGP